MESQICKECGKPIRPITAQKTGGICRTCFNKQGLADFETQKQQLASNTSGLPRPQHLDERATDEILQSFFQQGGPDEMYLAVSGSFWEVEEKELFETEYEAYKQYFHRIASELETVLGKPEFRGSYNDPGFPDWAVGETIVVWNIQGKKTYLRIHHEDRELPIIIALSRA